MIKLAFIGPRLFFLGETFITKVKRAAAGRKRMGEVEYITRPSPSLFCRPFPSSLSFLPFTLCPIRDVIKMGEGRGRASKMNAGLFFSGHGRDTVEQAGMVYNNKKGIKRGTKSLWVLLKLNSGRVSEHTHNV